MSDQHGSYAYYRSLITELMDTAADAVAMLERRLEPDPVFLLDVCATAGLLEHADLEDGPRLLRDALYRAATADVGRVVLSRATALLDLGPGLDLDPDGDMVEQGDRLARLAELAGLATVCDHDTRERLQERLDHNAALVLAYSDHFDTLWDSAAFLRDAIAAPKSHLVQAFLSEVLTSLAPVFYSVDHDAIAAKVGDLLAMDRRSFWQRLADRLKGPWAAVGELFDTAVPVTAYAAHGTARLAWPARRLFLVGDTRGELAILHSHVPLLEWWPGSAVPSDIRLGSQSLQPARGPLPEARYWQLDEVSEGEDLEIVFDQDPWVFTWSTLHPTLSQTTDPTFLRWRHVAPGAARDAVLKAHTRESSAAARHELLALSEALEPTSLEHVVGLTWVPVVGSDTDTFPGALLRMGLAAPGSKGLPEVETHVQATLRALGIASPPSIRLDLEGHTHSGIAVEGRSLELAGLLTTVSRLIGRASKIAIASGLLDGDQIAPAADLDTKEAVCRREAPQATRLLPATERPVREVLSEAFGDDAMTALLSACQASAANLVHQATHAMAQGDPGAARLARAGLDAGANGMDAAYAHWVLGARALHDARTDDALGHLEAARQALASSRGRPRRFLAAEFESFLAIAHLDKCQPTRAMSVLGPVLGELDAVAEHDRDARWDEVRIQVSGSLARAELMVGHLEQAIALLEGSLAVSDVPHERARTLGDLADLYRRAGRLEEGRATLSRARTELFHIPAIVQRERTMRFHSLFEVRAGLAAPHFPIVSPRWHEWPQPAEVLESLIAADRKGLASWVLDALEDPALPVVGLILFRSALARVLGSGASAETIVQTFATIETRLRVAGADEAVLSLSAKDFIRACPY